MKPAFAAAYLLRLDSPELGSIRLMCPQGIETLSTCRQWS